MVQRKDLQVLCGTTWCGADSASQVSKGDPVDVQRFDPPEENFMSFSYAAVGWRRR